jgi:protein-tyrosine-phosphatase
MLGHIYQDSNDISSTIESAVHTWLRDIGVAKARHEKLVVFVSYGGTCRCAMSKIVARRAFAGKTLPWSLRFESMASVFGNRTCASDGARNAVMEAFGQDYLASHKVMSRNAGIIDDADLILVMGNDLAKACHHIRPSSSQSFLESRGECRIHGRTQTPKQRSDIDAAWNNYENSSNRMLRD